MIDIDIMITISTLILKFITFSFWFLKQDQTPLSPKKPYSQKTTIPKKTKTPNQNPQNRTSGPSDPDTLYWPC